jgi:signal transduction histidine kinase/CheY-like chemotaxis protein
MFACQREQLIGQVASDPGNTNSPHYINKATEYIQRAVSDGPQSFEWLAKPGEAKAFWVEVVLRSADIAGEPCVVAVLRDITARRRLEQQVREAETFRAVGQLAGGIAHDFNNQLMGIMGNAEFLRQAVVREADFQACIDSILASSRRAADLTKQLLAFARRGRRRNVPVDLHQLITEVIALGRRSIDKRIAIEQHTNAQHTVSQGDPSALQNALLNLLVNARDAMPLGGTVLFTTRNVELKAEAARASRRTLSPGQYIEIDVTDTGSGIAADVVGRVFEPFFTTKESGTGMGLAAVQGTMLDHQGSVAVVSELGRGTTFRLLLPVVDASIESEPARSSRPLIRGSQGRILVVDDEPTVLSVIERVLQQSGYDVTVCTGGQQALSYYASNRFDLVLLDVMMPDLDGVEILQRLRAAHPTARVMLMTGHAEENVQARLLDFSDVPVISKPFLPNELIEEVQKFSFR